MAKPFERIAVVGTGTLGAQIALLAANAGYSVNVFDQQPGAFDQMIQKLKADLKAKQVDPFIAFEQWDVCKGRIRQFEKLAPAVKDADLVIEAVPENLELKEVVFRQLGEIAPPEAVLATNSSSIPVSRLEQSSGRPERCLNLHFYMALQGMNIADVMGGSCTLPEVMEKGIRLRSIGRPEFCTTRPSLAQVSPATPEGSSIRSSRSRSNCSPSPRQMKSTSGHCNLTSAAFKLAKTPPNASLTVELTARIWRARIFA